jgi:hypothetical protein
MIALNVCTHCSTPLQAGQKYCDVCGSLIDTSREKVFNVACEVHPDHYAIGLCVICAKPVCTDCEVKSARKILCNDPDHRIVLEEWRKIYQADSEFETEALVRNLADCGIAAKTFSLHDHIATHWLNENRVCLFVKKSEEEKAIALLKELNLVGNY